uniref:Uncharacterized protein n=1 Tax=Arundo donax TaxID=35708 RepID=A0A0A9DFE8_ARUDO
MMKMMIMQFSTQIWKGSNCIILMNIMDLCMLTAIKSTVVMMQKNLHHQGKM